MSWSRLLAGLSRTSAVMAAVLGLGGCLQPMYTTVGGNLGAELRAIAVDPVPERLGHYLQDQLITDLNGTGSSVKPKYHLILTPIERVQTALIDIVTQRAQAATVVTDIHYRLVPVDGTAVVATGVVSSAATYDRSAQRYANIRAARDAEIRNAKTVADQLTNRIAAALSRPRPVPVPVIPPTGSRSSDLGWRRRRVARTNLAGPCGARPATRHVRRSTIALTSSRPADDLLWLRSRPPRPIAS